MDIELSPDQLRHVAYHEAGHAVVMHALGMPFGKVSILANQQSFGRTEPGGGEWKWANQQGEPARLIRHLHSAICHLSGDVAEARITLGKPFRIMPLRGEQGIKRLDKDRPAATSACGLIVVDYILGRQGGGSAHGSDCEEAGIVEQVLQWATMALVEMHWQEVEAVANALLEQRELSDDQVAVLCETGP